MFSHAIGMDILVMTVCLTETPAVSLGSMEQGEKVT